MKRFLYIIFLSVLTAGCIEEQAPLIDNGSGALKDGYLTVDFGHKSFEDITITTRSTVPEQAEDAVINIYAYIFDENGNRIYSHFFDLENRVADATDINGLSGDQWYVNNRGTSNSWGAQYPNTAGALKIKSPAAEKLSGGKIFLLANLDLAMINVTEERLNLIKTKEELQKLSVKFNQESTSRTGNLLMLGSADIEVSGNTVTVKPDVEGDPNATGPVLFERLDAKVEVKVGVVPGYVTTTTDKFGRVQSQTIASFTPTSWKVVNLPKDSWVLARAAVQLDPNWSGNIENATKEGGFFDSSVHLFETKENLAYTYTDPATNQTYTDNRDVHGFSFYMLENIQTDPDQTISDYHLRDKRNKDTDGSYVVVDGNEWEYAPKDATYLVVEGEVMMDVNDDVQGAQTLNAHVKYYVHLGDFGTSLNNFDVVRNTHYVYNINIKGVNKIEVEVSKDQTGTWSPDNEEQSGATGEVYIAQEGIHTFDAHYGQRAICFNFDAILRTLGIKVENGVIDNSFTGVKEEIAKDLTWYISSPFGREGTPDMVTGGVEVPNGLDYKWVYFLINDINEDGYYDERNQWYPGPYKGQIIPDDAVIPNNPTAKGKRLMDVSQLCNFLKNQIARYATGATSVFDNNHNIWFTAFVDEFYYDADPISGETRPFLWQEFVNKPMRMMHILCSADVSRDGESSATGSIVTIRQNSIQTVYNTASDLESVWGCESLDEIRSADEGVRDSVGFFDKNNDNSTGSGINTADYAGNDSKQNGLYNTARLWGLYSGSSYASRPWTDFLDYDRVNDYQTTISAVPNRSGSSEGNMYIGFMKDDNATATLRYSCAMRNRDNNGNGEIDEDEVRWYLASTEQLMTLFLGDLGLSTEAQLYNITPTPNDYKSHVVSSTSAGNIGCSPQIIWAEEGCSIGPYYKYDYPNDSYRNEFSVRCVRNLGTQHKPLDENNYPPSPIKIETGTSVDNYNVSTFRFDASNLNSASKRIKVSEELVPLDEFSEMSRLYNGFETGHKYPYSENYISSTSYQTRIKDYLIGGYSYCPEGYRLPNLREAAVMYLLISDSNFWNADYNGAGFAVSTYFSLGPSGKGYSDYYNRVTWHFTNSRVSISENPLMIRCVRDIDP